MQPIRENWTRLEGALASHRPAPERPGFVELVLDVRATRPVEGFADLLADRAGKRVKVFAREEWLAGKPLEEGARVVLRARRGASADALFAHADHIEVERG